MIENGWLELEVWIRRTHGPDVSIWHNPIEWQHSPERNEHDSPLVQLRCEVTRRGRHRRG
jgi:hypothetical protein